MPDRENVVRAFEQYVYNFVELTTTDEYNHQILEQVLVLLKEQEKIINELLDLGYPHNFQHEVPWVVDYLYKLTEIIKKAFMAMEGR